MALPTKDEWRDRARAARAGLVVDHDAHVRSLAEFLRGIDPAPRWVLTYHPMADEVDVWPLCTDLVGVPGLGFAVTRTPGHGRDLTIHPVGGPLERHRYGFEQPTADAPVVPDGAIDAVVVPGLAFDRLGNRLGHGAGYYDRLLARVRPGIPLVGVTGGYVVAELPTEDHDVAMTHLCGPFGVLGVPLPDPEG
jgi:5-formyltetrahydrofolate cyclo-ligase